MADLLESQYLFEIYHTLFTIKNSENVVKSGKPFFSKNLCEGERQIFFRNKGGT